MILFTISQPFSLRPPRGPFTKPFSRQTEKGREREMGERNLEQRPSPRSASAEWRAKVMLRVKKSTMGKGQAAPDEQILLTLHGIGTVQMDSV